MRFERASDGCSYAPPPPDVASESGGTVTCELGTLANGQSTTVEIVVTPQAAGTFVSEPGVFSPQIGDPIAANNKASVRTVVEPRPVPPAGQVAAPTSGPLQVVLTDSYVLISGRSVKLVKGKFVPVKLTCAGQRKCEGTITITTAKPVSSTKKPRKGRKRKRKVARLGSKKFSIAANRQRKVLVPLSRAKVRLLKRLKRVKAKATIREIDVKGRPRISMRTFVLRAR
jgi:hypothetical protein